MFVHDVVGEHRRHVGHVFWRFIVIAHGPLPLVFGGRADRRADLGLRVGLEVGGRVDRDTTTEQTVDRSAADAGELSQKFSQCKGCRIRYADTRRLGDDADRWVST